MAHTYRLVYNPFVYRLVFSPFVMKLMAKYTFPLLTRYHTRYHSAEDVVFLNFGYEEDPPMALPLAASDEANRFCIQLYHRTATQVDLSGKRVLEVGCGHGGGASYLMRTLRPASYTGLDLNPAGIDFCRKRHNLAGLDFVRGDAENLPFDDQSFDAVINIESSHCYPHFSRFLAEVARVLRAGGHFLYADLRPRVCIAEWESALADAPMRLLSDADIGSQISRGMERNSQRTPDLVSHRGPAYVHGVAREATASQGSGLYRAVHSGEFSYRIYRFAKEWGGIPSGGIASRS
ncbi:MAG: class SAM-dependent methyltransferase [Mycobacterium sp.]|jgi:SAM-dependent methyltransferase|nr:class SAM-dependent methyltransferase [Mycobacterium sp.]